MPDPGNTTTAYINDIPTGSYNVTVTDPVGCQAVAAITLPEPPPLLALDANTFITDASCTGGQDGEIFITPIGGTTADGNYTFSWDTGSVENAATSTINNLNPGAYCVTVTDDNGCETEECYTVGAVKQLSFIEIITEPICFGLPNGEIFVTGNTAGAPADTPYSFNWSANTPAANNTATTSEISVLVAGEYTLTMTDASPAGCQIVETFTVSQPDPIMANLSNSSNESCSVGNDAFASFVAAGGTPPYTYRWSHDMGLMDTIANNLSAGTYQITVVDVTFVVQKAA